MEESGVPLAEKGGGGTMSQTKEKHKCAWCEYPNAQHQGGFRKPNGSQGTEWFCDMEHFERWLKWQSMFAPVREQVKLTQFAVGGTPS